MTPKLCPRCGEPVPARYVLHKHCLDALRASYPYRQVALERDGYVCAQCPTWRNRWALHWCRRLGWTRRVDVDHIVPLGAGGPNSPQNLQVLCKHHHRVKTRYDLAAMRGKPLPRWRAHPWLAFVALVALWRLLLLAADHRTADLLLPTIGMALWTTLALAILLRARTRLLRRLRAVVASVTNDAVTKKRMLAARRWRVVRVPGLRLPRLRPTDLTVRYPHTFPDHNPAAQTELESRVAAKLGGTWYAQWNTDADKVRLRSPDPLVSLAGAHWPHAAAHRLSLWDPIPVGLGTDGQPVTILLPGKNLLIGGEPESGKSVAQSMITATAALDPDAVLYGIDGKGLVELGWWRDSMDKLVGSGPDGHKDATDLLQHLRSVMDMRYEMLFEAGKRKIERGDGYPLHVLIIDELALFTSGGTKPQRDAFIEALRDVISRGRAAGVIVVAATQRPSADVVPTQIRDLIGYRWAMRCATPASSDMILGQGQASAGYSAAKVAAATRGIGYLLAEGTLPVRLRSYYIDNPTLEALAGRAAQQRGVGVAQPTEAEL